MIFQFFEIILHLDKYLQAIVSQYAGSTYGILFLIIFLETGVVVTPFLPGDSLLFAAGSLAALGAFDVKLLFLLLFIAAVLGDTLNYHLGKLIGPRIFSRESSFFFNKEHLERAKKFYEKYGKKTIILARFVPIIRTFAPFVAGIGVMPYPTFLVFNVIGAAAWCGLFIIGGFWFGNIPWIQEHFGVFIIAIIAISLLPLLKEMIVIWAKKTKTGA